MRKFGLTAAAVAIAALFCVPAAQAQKDVKVGVLTCSVSSGWGFIFGSTRDLHCTYQDMKGSIEFYSGHISKFGVDIGYTRAAVMVWAVFAPASTIEPGALAGPYAGATASATIGIGVGANALVGGLKNSLALQPVSIEGNTGLNVAAGVAEMTLRHRM